MAALVSCARDSDRHDLPDAGLDALLLKAFPGRTLDELEDMDWGRWQRATEAQVRLDVERLRAGLLDGTRKGKDLPAGVLEMIREHDALVGEDDDDG